MYIIEVIPLTLLPPNVPQLLTYFFDRKLENGSVVEVAIGNRKVNAVVFSSVPLEQRKIMLKNSDFQLKKINKIINGKVLVSETQFRIAGWLSQYYYAPLGYCLKTVLPAFFLNKKYDWKPANVGSDEKKHGNSTKHLLLLTKAKETIKNIQPFIKDALNDKSQVLIMVPETGLIKFYYEELAKYHEVSLIHSRMTIQKLFKSWKDISSSSTEIIIGTRQGLFAPFKKLGLVVVDDPGNEAYKSDMTPKYNTQNLAARVAEANNCKVIYTAAIPAVTDYFNVQNGACETSNKIGSLRTPIKVVDMIKELKSGNFSLLSRDLKNSIDSAVENNKKILIFSPRKGFSGVLACQNCGFLAKCPNCSVPMRVHKVPEAMMICHRCSGSGKIPTSCPNCNSSELKAVGVAGSQKVAEELERHLKMKGLSAPVYLFDADSINGPKKEKELIEQIKISESPVVVATHKIFSQRYYQNFDIIGVLNTDALASSPDFRSDERLFCQLEKLLDFEPESVVVQSYNAESPVMSAIASGDYKTFYDKELAGREMFYYPPFSRIAKLTFKHQDREKAVYAARILSEKLKMVIAKTQMDNSIKIIGPSPAYVEREKGFYIYNLVLKIPTDMGAEEILKYVPSYWSIDLDPRSVV